MTLRKATLRDVPALRLLIDASVRGLQTGEYSAEQIELGLRYHYGPDSQLIGDGTYFVVEDDGRIVASGGWSMRRTLSGGDQAGERDETMLDPSCDAARIRAFFVHPDYARRGLGSMILCACEDAAHAAGFHRLEMAATVTGVPFYRAHGYREEDRWELPFPGGGSMPVVRMVK